MGTQHAAVTVCLVVHMASGCYLYQVLKNKNPTQGKDVDTVQWKVVSASEPVGARVPAS